MATKKKMLQAAAGQAGGGPLDITDVFSTYLYDGTGSTQTITNGIDLDGKGGLVWLKSRSNTYDNWLYDTVRGNTVRFISNSTAAQGFTGANGITSFNSDGFGLGAPFAEINGSGSTFASWTFRKAPKFFDIVEYSYQGNSAGTSVQIAHNLGSAPGLILIKAKDKAESFIVWHKDVNGYFKLAYTDSVSTGPNAFGSSPSMTDTHFSVGYDGATNFPGYNYVAYLFAHNDGDGEFGPDGDQDIIKCGSYTGNGDYLNGKYVDVGFEPQWILQKAASTTGPWLLLDTMRGWDVNTGNKPRLLANATNTEANSNSTFALTGDSGFTIYDTSNSINGNGQTYIYMAIRRGPLAPPESATEVFAIDTAGGTSPTPPTFTSGFPVDFSFYKNKTDGSNNWGSQNRLTGYGDLAFNTTSAEFSNNGSYWQKDYMNGIGSNTGTNSNGYQWMWKRAPGFFDVVAYTGNYTDGRTVTHNLGVSPEMIWVKLRDTYSAEWMVFHKDLATNHNLQLDSTAASADYSGRIRTPTATTFTVGNDTSVNRQSPLQYIAYLFASLPGISKVGSYTGTGNTAQTIDCGFTSGARFVLIKRSSGASQWHVFDTERGITSTVNDGVLYLNLTNAEQPESSAFGASIDAIQPDNSGFKVQYSDINGSGETFIFYAIA